MFDPYRIALVIITRHEGERLTYIIQDPYHSGVVQVSLEILEELLARAGIEKEQ